MSNKVLLNNGNATKKLFVYKTFDKKDFAHRRIEPEKQKITPSGV